MTQPEPRSSDHPRRGAFGTPRRSGFGDQSIVPTVSPPNVSSSHPRTSLPTGSLSRGTSTCAPFTDDEGQEGSRSASGGSLKAASSSSASLSQRGKPEPATAVLPLTVRSTKGCGYIVVPPNAVVGETISSRRASMDSSARGAASLNPSHAPTVVLTRSVRGGGATETPLSSSNSSYVRRDGASAEDPVSTAAEMKPTKSSQPAATKELHHQAVPTQPTSRSPDPEPPSRSHANLSTLPSNATAPHATLVAPILTAHVPEAATHKKELIGDAPSASPLSSSELPETTAQLSPQSAARRKLQRSASPLAPPQSARQLTPRSDLKKTVLATSASASSLPSSSSPSSPKNAPSTLVTDGKGRDGSKDNNHHQPSPPPATEEIRDEANERTTDELSARERQQRQGVEDEELTELETLVAAAESDRSVARTASAMRLERETSQPRPPSRSTSGDCRTPPAPSHHKDGDPQQQCETQAKEEEARDSSSVPSDAATTTTTTGGGGEWFEAQVMTTSEQLCLEQEEEAGEQQDEAKQDDEQESRPLSDSNSNKSGGAIVPQASVPPLDNCAAALPSAPLDDTTPTDDPVEVQRIRNETLSNSSPDPSEVSGTDIRGGGEQDGKTEGRLVVERAEEDGGNLDPQSSLFRRGDSPSVQPPPPAVDETTGGNMELSRKPSANRAPSPTTPLCRPSMQRDALPPRRSSPARASSPSTVSLSSGVAFPRAATPNAEETTTVQQRPPSPSSSVSELDAIAPVRSSLQSAGWRARGPSSSAVDEEKNRKGVLTGPTAGPNWWQPMKQQAWGEPSQGRVASRSTTGHPPPLLGSTKPLSAAVTKPSMESTRSLDHGRPTPRAPPLARTGEVVPPSAIDKAPPHRPVEVAAPFTPAPAFFVEPSQPSALAAQPEHPAHIPRAKSRGPPPPPLISSSSSSSTSAPLLPRQVLSSQPYDDKPHPRNHKSNSHDDDDDEEDDNGGHSPPKPRAMSVSPAPHPLSMRGSSMVASAAAAAAVTTAAGPQVASTSGTLSPQQGFVVYQRPPSPSSSGRAGERARVVPLTSAATGVMMMSQPQREKLHHLTRRSTSQIPLAGVVPVSQPARRAQPPSLLYNTTTPAMAAAPKAAKGIA